MGRHAKYLSEEERKAARMESNRKASRRYLEKNRAAPAPKEFLF